MSENKYPINNDSQSIELIDNNLVCFIGQNDYRIKSSDAYEQVKSKKINVKYSISGKGEITLGEDKYQFYFPIFEKPIKIIDSQGLEYKSKIYFFEDIKNIILYLNMKNPHYMKKKTKKFIELKPSYYGAFLTGENYIIKDINYSIVNYEELKNIYNRKMENLKKKDSIQIESIKLKNLNDNIIYYSNSFKLPEEEIIYTKERSSFMEEIIDFYENSEKKILNVFGNYASGKSISLILYNNSLEFPTLYLNLKAIKNSFQSSAYTTIFPNEVINMFIKAKKNFEEFENFIKLIYKNDYKTLDNFIVTIINLFIEWKGIIFLDQFNHELFNDEIKLINTLKSLLNPENSKLKVLLINSLNDKYIRNLYIDYILNIFDERENEIDCIFLKKLISKDNPLFDNFEKDLYPYLELFEFLPLYYSLILENKERIKEFISETKTRIDNKINKFFITMGNEDNIIQMNEIRIKIDEEIDKNFFEKYKDYTPFKYFYIDYIDSITINELPGLPQNDIHKRKLILKCYFPLIKEIWEKNIYNKTLQFFDGEINYKGSTIGSLLELNFINQCESGYFPLDIDCHIELDTLAYMESLIKSNTDVYKNKNIFITQKKENAPFFDVGFLRAKNVNNPEIAYIQIKKSYSENKINKDLTFKTFENNRNKFSKLLGIIPHSCYLIYITLLNTSIKETIISFETDKRNLDKEKIDMVKRINMLHNFCIKNSIILYYFNPKEKKFFIRNGKEFTETDLNLFEKNSIVSAKKKLDIKFASRKRTIKLSENEKIVENYNQKFSKKLLEKNEFISTEDGYKFYFDVVYEFIKTNCTFGKISSFIFLNSDYDDIISYENTSGIIILGLCKNKSKSFSIKSVIYDNYIINYENAEERQFIDSFEISVEVYDLLVWIDFKDFTTKGRIFKSNYF